MENDLIARYLYAVTKRMPRKKREDVTRELQGLIEDMLAERCGPVTPTEKDIRVVLTELGSPQELYEKYDEGGKKCLIGPPYYGTYCFVLKIILACSAFGLTLAAIILQILEPRPWYAAVGNWLAMLWSGVMGAFAFTTLLYAFFYHKGVKLDTPFRFEDLPPVPKKKQEIPVGECVFGIVITVAFLVVFLAAPQIFCVIFEKREWIPIFDTQAIRGTWYIILLFSLTGIIREAVKLMERRYSRRVLVTVCVADLISGGLSIWWLSTKDLVNPVFITKMQALFQEDGAFIATVFGRFQYFFLGIILFALVLDMATAIVKGIAK